LSELGDVLISNYLNSDDFEIDSKELSGFCLEQPCERQPDQILDEVSDQTIVSPEPKNMWSIFQQSVLCEDGSGPTRRIARAMRTTAAEPRRLLPLAASRRRSVQPQVLELSCSA